MKKLYLGIALAMGLCTLSSCENRSAADDEYLEVIGEYEQHAPDAGYRINLSYNGPVDMRDRFQVWADSLQQQHPSMVKMNENIYLHYMPEQMDKRVRQDMFQVGVTYILTVDDTAAFTALSKDALKRNFPFNMNVMGTSMDPAKKAKLQQEMMQKAMDDAKGKLDFLSSTTNRGYEVVGVEELENTPPFGHEYYDASRRIAMRLKVKARLQ